MGSNVNVDSMLRVGAVLDGKYRIERYLSSGGFGNTYVAYNQLLEERVAIKEFFIRGISQRDTNSATVSVTGTENRDQFDQQLEKFKKEARRLRRLHDEHIVAVHDLFEENGTAYYVMDFIDGLSLAERIKSDGHPLSEAEALSVLRQMLAALDTVHKSGLYHLDMKPGNILMDSHGHATLIDFGASKQMGTGGAATSTALAYTPGYAPREQMEQNRDKFGPWTDLYALGATLYNLLTGNRPPLATDIDDNGDDAFSYPQGVSEPTRRLVSALMATSYRRRPQSVDDVLQMMGQPHQPQPQPKHQPQPQQPAGDATVIENPVADETVTAGEAQPVVTVAELPTELQGDAPKSNTVAKVITWLAVLVILAVGGLYGAILTGLVPMVSSADEGEVIDYSEELAQELHLTNMGDCVDYVYTGPVVVARHFLDGTYQYEESVPNGLGEAYFADGRKYIGKFDHGITGDSVMIEFQQSYKYTAGRFRGVVENGYMVKGRFTDEATKKYFVGDFVVCHNDKDFNEALPAVGTWYYPDGRVLQHVQSAGKPEVSNVCETLAATAAPVDTVAYVVADSTAVE